MAAALLQLKEKTLEDVRLGMPVEEAKELAKAARTMAQALAKNPKQSRAVEVFEAKAKKCKSGFNWKGVLGAVLGAALGLVVGALIGLALGPGAAMVALAAGAYGAKVGAALGGSIGAFAGGSLGFWQHQRSRPELKAVRAAKEVQRQVMKAA